MLDTSPVVSIWLEMSINWPTKSQGPKKKLVYSSSGRINPWPAHTARNKGSFTPYALWSVKSFFSPTVYSTETSQDAIETLRNKIFLSNQSIICFT